MCEYLKARQREKETGERGAKEDREGEHEQSEDVPCREKPSEGAPGPREHPAASSLPVSSLPATHPAASSPKNTPPLAEGTVFAGTPYPAPGVKLLATEPPMAHPVSEPVASGSSYVGIHEQTPGHEPDAFPGAAVGVCTPTILAYTMPEHAFSSLSGVQRLEFCG